jgi:predicted DNA-binding protein (MmcQ/YjbR family)
VALNRDGVRDHCASMPHATWDFPYGPTVRVFRVGGKTFALVSEAQDDASFKCDPGLAEILRGQYAAVRPGYHLNKRHWNTVTLDGSVPDDQVLEMVRHSYDLVFAGLPRRTQASLSQS